MIPQQRGMAVLVVLLLIAVMTMLAVTTSERFVQATRRAATLQFVLQARWTLLGAENWLIQQPADVRSRRTASLQLQQSLINYRWRDRQGCFNLNALGLPQPVNSPPAQQRSTPVDSLPQKNAVPSGNDALTQHSVAQQVFLRLLANLQVPAPEAHALLAHLRQRIARGGLDEISQLRDAETGVSVALWHRLAPLVCVQPAGPLRININTLTPRQTPLFQALFNGALSAAQAQQLLNSRPADGWQALQQIVPPGQTAQTSAAITTLLSVAVLKSEAWELLMWTAEGEHSYSLRSRLRQQDGQMQVTDRLYGLSEEYSGDVF